MSHGAVSHGHTSLPWRGVAQVAAAALFSLHNLAESFNSNGYEANYIEFGGDHCATLYAVGNAAANVPGFVAAWLGALCRSKFGKSRPLFSICNGLLCVTTTGSF